MRRTTRWALAVALLLPFAACSGSPPPPPPPPTPVPAAPVLSQRDRDFINQAATGGLAEIRLGQLAIQQATSPAVRKFGQHMIDQHTRVDQQLGEIAQARGVTLPSTLDPAQEEIMAQLAEEHGSRFNLDYLHNQVAAHQAQLELFQQEVSDGTDADLKAFAAQTIPVIQRHLAQAQRLLGSHRLR